jgi:hypothetical protein
MFEELGPVVRRILLAVLDRRDVKLTCDIIGSVFGYSLRRGYSDNMLSQRHGLSNEAFQQMKRDLIRQVGLRVVTRGELLPYS